MRRSKSVVGLDIGTTKICTVIAEAPEEGHPRILGVGLVPSQGLKRGTVVDIEETVESIRSSVEAAERHAGQEVHEAFVGITGDHISSLNVTGRVSVSPGPEVTAETVEQALAAAQDAVSLPHDREIIHRLVRQFILDGQPGVRRPIGMSGLWLEAETHIVTGVRTVMSNLATCVQQAGLEMEERVLEPIATAEAVLEEAERELGVMLIDIGGGTTDIAVFHHGSICHTSALPVAGHHVTRDLAVGVRAAPEQAQKLKHEYGDALAEAVPEDDLVTVVPVGSDEEERIPRRLLAEIIQPRLEETFSLVANDVRRTGLYDLLAGGAVITGGGSQLPHTAELASSVLDDMPVRVGRPAGLAGLADMADGPIYATGVGLALYGAKRRRERAGVGRRVAASQSLWRRLKSRVRELIWPSG